MSAVSERAKRIAAEILAEPQNMQYGASSDFFARNKNIIMIGTSVVIGAAILGGIGYYISRNSKKGAL